MIGYFVSSAKLKSQDYLNKINTWAIKPENEDKQQENKGNANKFHKKPSILHKNET